jgi:ssDNA-binding Zn-finger/Zn-ribbon topoisomerase 1
MNDTQMNEIEFSSRIAHLIQAFAAKSDFDLIDLHQLAITKNVLPLVWDTGGVFAINPEGEVISFSWDDWGNPRVETDLRLRNNALFGGSKKYPELKELIQRPRDARVCPYCGGSGIDRYAKKLNTDVIVCYCGGLGWIP